MICSDVLRAVNEGRSPLVLTERTEHLQELGRRLSPYVPHLISLRGGQTRRDLESALARLNENPGTSGRVILATGKFIGEGFDDPRLDTLFLALPVSWRGTIAQYVGRLHRLHDCKREVRVYDYADLNVPMLSRMFDRRCRGYDSLGYAILLPASAFQDGLSRFRFRLIQNGRKIMPPAFDGSFAMGRTFRLQKCLRMRRGIQRAMPKARTEPGAPAKLSFFADWKPCRKQTGVFA
jgi:superfamily II DNA or RNA helicase